MKIVYFGTPPFAAQVLGDLVRQGCEIVAVVTRTDKPKGRSGDPVPTPVKEVALSHNIPVYQPEKVSSDDFKSTLESFNADLFVVVAYGEILKQHVLDAPKKGCINLHASLLPKYRGAAPIQRAIIEGENESGISIMFMVKKMDAGDVIQMATVPISANMTYGELEQKLCEIGSVELIKVIRMFEKGPVAGAAQDESKVTFAPKIELEDCEIDWSKDAQAIHNLIRGVNPHPGAWCFVTVRGEKKRLKIFRTELQNESGAPKTAEVRKGEPLIYCGKNAVLLKEVQLEGKKRMQANELFRGIPIDQFGF